MQVWSCPRTTAMQPAHALCACRIWFCRQLRFVEVAQLTDSVQQAEIKNTQTHCTSIPCKLYQPLALPFSLSTWPSFSEVGFLGGFLVIIFLTISVPDITMYDESTLFPRSILLWLPAEAYGRPPKIWSDVKTDNGLTYQEEWEGLDYTIEVSEGSRAGHPGRSEIAESKERRWLRVFVVVGR